MSSKIIIGLVAVVLVIGGIGFYSSQKTKTEMAMAEQQKKDIESKAMMDKKAMDLEQISKDETVQKDTMMKTDDNSTTSGKEAMMKKDQSAMMIKAGTYESYDASKIALANSDHKVVLFFRASWCPTCISLDKDIKAHLNDIPSNLTILDVDYDKYTDLKQKYGVTYQHTFVKIDANGTLIKKWSGSPTLAALVKEVK